MMRWTATLYYRTELGLIVDKAGFEELEEIHDIVESGPDWRTLDRIEIRLANNNTPGLTIEGALAEGRTCPGACKTTSGAVTVIDEIDSHVLATE